MSHAFMNMQLLLIVEGKPFNVGDNAIRTSLDSIGIGDSRLRQRLENGRRQIDTRQTALRNQSALANCCAKFEPHEFVFGAFIR